MKRFMPFFNTNLHQAKQASVSSIKHWFTNRCYYITFKIQNQELSPVTFPGLEGGCHIDPDDFVGLHNNSSKSGNRDDELPPFHGVEDFLELPKFKSIEEPEPNGLPHRFDVLCGQSRTIESHTGNRRFQVVLDMYSARYSATQSKKAKMLITREIVASIETSGGRFLKYKDDEWTEIPTVTARDKVSHALRTKLQSVKREQKKQAVPVASSKKRAKTSCSSKPPSKKKTKR